MLKCFLEKSDEDRRHLFDGLAGLGSAYEVRSNRESGSDGLEAARRIV